MYKGYFEARQLTSGAIAIGFVPIAQESDGSKPITRPVYSEPSFHGRDTDGWDISTCGQTVAPPMLGLLGAPDVFRSQCIRARRHGTTESGYSKVQFLVSNLLWHDRNVMPEPITLEIGELTLTVAPIGDYLEVAGSIMAMRGIAPTAQVLIEASDTSNRSLEYFGNLMDDLVSIFRLATGNRVDWYYGEAFGIGTETVVERLHKDAVTGPFSSVVRFRPLRSGQVSATPRLDLKTLAESFLGDDKNAFDRSTLKELINYFVNACDETSYLEARGLLASTLLDLIVLKYAQGTKTDNIVEEDEFRIRVLPRLKEAIRNVSLPEPAEELRDSALNQLDGAYRRSFRTRLYLLTKELDLRLDKKARSRAVDIRNKLVHDGTYLANKNGDDWYSQYRFMIWLDLLALCRLAGYGDDLPLRIWGGRLQV